MKKKMMLLVLISVLFLIVSGCGARKYEAVPVDESVDKCVICNMQIKDDAFATQLTTTEGKTYKFDDIGCMNEWEEKNSSVKIGAAFVRDYNDKEWIPYEKAYYLYNADFKSPMAYGIYSFKDKESAEKFKEEQGKGQLMTAVELAKHNWEQNKEQMNMAMGDMNSNDSDQGSADSGMDMTPANAGENMDSPS
jgi:copper chaperone NosL